MNDYTNKAEAQIDEWIERGIVVDYLALKYQFRPDMMMVGEREGFGRLRRPHEGVIMLSSPAGEEFPVYCHPDHVIEYCEPEGGYSLQVRTLTGDACIALKPSNYAY